MILPSVSKCKENKRQLIKKWLKNSTFNDKELEKRKYFFQKCFVFHYFTIPNEIAYCRNLTSKISELLPDRLLKSSYDIRVSNLFRPVGNTLEKLDPLLGLDQYVFFSFGAPIKRIGKTTLVFGLPLQKLLDKYEYPQIWVSWGDIITYAVDMLGDQFFHDRKINELQFSRIAQQYQEAIFLPEDIAELAAVFTISHGMDISETINRKWYKRRTGYFGPEIKIFRNFPLKYITHCFINLLKLKIQLPFWLSDPFRKQNAPALNQGISL
ncbi:MAG TPA: hypothetical protein GXX59_02390 [Syntrophomonadaceae bacterium]|jgi:hypothetical protein|nr:hypothetical protein [Syntrophomonadaceae bacterium]